MHLSATGPTSAVKQGGEKERHFVWTEKCVFEFSYKYKNCNSTYVVHR